MKTKTDSHDSFSTGLGLPPPTSKKGGGTKRARPKKKAGRDRDVRSEANWVPILRVNAYDFDEEAGKFLDSSQTVELQQDTTSKKIRAIVIPD